MNQTRIEKKGINSVSEYINDCGYMDDHLSKNDKTPLWDGDIFIYKTEDKFDKDSYRYSIKVQVKASEWNRDKFPSTKNYEVRIKDLQKYYNDGGVIYFVSLVGKNKTSKVYCCILSKIQIKYIMESAKGEKYTKVTCTPVPSAMEFLQEVESLHLQYNHTIISPKNLIDKKFSLRIPTPYFQRDMHFFSYLATHYNDVLVKLEGIPGEFYLENQSRLESHNVIDLSIKVNDKEYFNKVGLSFIEKGIECNIGKSVTLLFPHKIDKLKPNDVNISYHYTGSNIKEAKHELSFLIDTFNSKHFFLEKCKVPLEGFSNETIEIQLDAWNSMLNFLNRLEKVFEILEVPDEIDIDSLTNLEAENLEVLTDAILDNAILEIDEPNDRKETHVENFQAGKLNIYVVLERTEDGGYQVKNLHEYVKVSFRTKNGKKLYRPIFSILLDREELPANLGIKKALSTYQQMLKEDPTCYYMICSDLERLLFHYEKKENKKYLHIALEIFKILFEFEEGNVDINIYTHLLGFEIYKRHENKLNQNYIERILEMESATKDNYLLFSIQVLLDNNLKAAWLLNRMDEKTLKFTKSKPIYNLFLKQKNNNG